MEFCSSDVGNVFEAEKEAENPENEE